MTETMRAMVLESPGQGLQLRRVPVPQPGADQVRVRVFCCAVCRTDLHLVEGDLPHPKRPVIPGHEVVGRIDALGDNVSGYKIGDRVGVPWLGHTCGHCRYCAGGQENLCDEAAFTGYTLDGGFADYVVADAHFTMPIPDEYDDISAAPLMCAGLIGYRAYAMAGDAPALGIYGFGAAAHIIAQIARFEQRRVFAFTRSGDEAGQAFARSLGAIWAGGSHEQPPEELDAAIIFAPVGALVSTALRAVRKGGVVVCAGIHMSDIPSFSYDILWGERVVRSVANLTRADGEAFLRLAPKAGVRTSTHCYRLDQANQALADLRGGKFAGAAVLTMTE